jgi:hypothetical protein
MNEISSLCLKCPQYNRVCGGKAFNKKYCIYQHIPSMVTGPENAIKQFDTLDELENIEFVNRFKSIMIDFRGFKIEDYMHNTKIMSAQYEK